MPESDRAAFASIVRKRHQLYVLIWALNFVLGYLYSDSTGICNLGFVFSCWYCILFGEKKKQSFQTVAWLLVHHGVRLCHCCSSDCRSFMLFKVGETICISEEQDIQYCCQFCICSVISGDLALPCAWGCRRWTVHTFLPVTVETLMPTEPHWSSCQNMSLNRTAQES